MPAPPPPPLAFAVGLRVAAALRAMVPPEPAGRAPPELPVRLAIAPPPVCPSPACRVRVSQATSSGG